MENNASFISLFSKNMVMFRKNIMNYKNIAQLKRLYPSVKLLKVYDKLFAYDAKSNLLTLVSEDNENNIEDIISKIKRTFEPFGLQQVVPEENHIEDIVIKRFKEYIPRKFVLEITEKCTLRCKYCFFSDKESERQHSNKDISYATMKNAVDYYFSVYIDAFKKISKEYHDYILKIAPPGISWWGGEPFINYGIIKESKKYIESLPWGEYGIEKDKFVYSIVTNFTVVNENILNFIISNNIYIFISLDGTQKEHDYNRIFANGKGSFDRVSENIDILIKKAPAYCKDYVVIQAVLANNIKDSQGIYALRKKYGIDTENSQVLKLQVYPQKTKSQYLPGILRKSHDEKRTLLDFKLLLDYLNGLPVEDLINYFKIHKKISDEFEDLFSMDKKFVYENFVSYNRYNKWFTCPAGIDNIFVSIDGDMHICNKSDYSFMLGNVNTGISPLKMKQFYSMYYEAIRNGECYNCWAVHFCGICPAAILKDGRFILPTKKECKIIRGRISLRMKKYIILLQNDDLYEKLKEKVFKLHNLSFLNYRGPLNIKPYEKD